MAGGVRSMGPGYWKWSILSGVVAGFAAGVTFVIHTTFNQPSVEPASFALAFVILGPFAIIAGVAWGLLVGLFTGLLARIGKARSRPSAVTLYAGIFTMGMAVLIGGLALSGSAWFVVPSGVLVILAGLAIGIFTASHVYPRTLMPPVAGSNTS